MSSLYLFITGKKLSYKVAVEYLEAEQGNDVIDGATFISALKALRRLGARFTYRAVNELQSTKSLEGRMVLTGDFETYTEPHAVLLYRKRGVIWLLDCLVPTGAYVIGEKHALRLIKRSDETYKIERL